MAKWVSRYGLQDMDEFVEKIPYRETKGYVESVFENYWNYMLVYNPEIGKEFDKLNSQYIKYAKTKGLTKEDRAPAIFLKPPFLDDNNPLTSV